MSGADAFVQVATDGPGKKIATEEFIRSTGDVVEVQQTLPTDPATGRALDAPPWEAVTILLRMILAELSVHTLILGNECKVSEREIEDARNEFMREMR